MSGTSPILASLNSVGRMEEATEMFYPLLELDQSAYMLCGTILLSECTLHRRNIL
jgi:hypothetical protein